MISKTSFGLRKTYTYTCLTDVNIIHFHIEKVYFLEENFASIARSLNLPFSAPRCTHHGVVQTRFRGADLFLIDRRRSIYGAIAYLKRRPANLIFAQALRGQSCTSKCESMSKTCDSAMLTYANSCREIEHHFPCESGCGHQIGTELPAYVVDSSQPTFRQCLVTDVSAASCSASHRSTRRLCVCL